MDLSMKKLTMKQNNQITKEQQQRFIEKLYQLLNNGYSTIEALEALKWDRPFVKPADHIIHELKHGASIDKAMDKAGFDSSITTFLFFVRANNDLEGSLAQCSNMFKQRIRHTKKFQQIIRYPLFLIFIFTILLFFIKTTILPSFVDMFQSNPKSYSTVKLSILSVDLLITCTLFVVLTCLVFLVLWKYVQPKLPIEEQIRILERIPVYRQYLKVQTSYFFATHFRSLLKSGIPFKDIIYHMANQKRLPLIAHYSSIMMNELSKGIHLSYILSNFSFLENHLTTIFHKNSDAEILEKDLALYSEFKLEEIEQQITKLITLIQPILFLAIGLFVIFIYVTLMWPMFQLIKTI
ncbi:competence type IV pilus assembly protein ComGB [Oceanobacillus piezotolerans]|nr:competence type IV pilus assembly protein ComGB [Oceanobacillus piezotolerans]